MRSVALATPGLLAGTYPERDEAARTPGLLRLPALDALQRRRRQRFVALVEERGRGLSSLHGAAFDARVRELRARLAAEGFADEPVAEAFALVREASCRTTGLRHYDVQILGGIALFFGAIAEMETGEAKTLQTEKRRKGFTWLGLEYLLDAVDGKRYLICHRSYLNSLKHLDAKS